MQQTFLSLKRESFKTAATTDALEGSITIFILSKTNWVAFIISSSLTKIISLAVRFYFIIPNVLSPKLVLRPSAILIGGNWGCFSPF